MAGLGNMEIAQAMLNAPEVIPKRGPRQAFYAGAEALERYKQAGYARSDAERSLDYVSPEDNATRRYITDEGMKVVSNDANTLGDAVKHPRMYAAYPSLKGLPVSYNQENEGTNGSYNPDTHAINLDDSQADSAMFSMYTPAIDRKGLIGHEVQHAITEMEGWEGGLGHLAGIYDNPRMYWNSGNEAQSRLVGSMIKDPKVTAQQVKDLNGPIPWMRDDMQRITDSPIFYGEKNSKAEKEFMAKEKAASEYWKIAGKEMAAEEAAWKAEFMAEGGTEAEYEKEYGVGSMTVDDGIFKDKGK